MRESGLVRVRVFFAVISFFILNLYAEPTRISLLMCCVMLLFLVCELHSWWLLMWRVFAIIFVF